jgi:hypothetical protein
MIETIGLLFAVACAVILVHGFLSRLDAILEELRQANEYLRCINHHVNDTKIHIENQGKKI